VRVGSLTRGGNDSGFAVDPDDYDSAEAQDGSGKTWKAAGYKLGHYEDTREPYEAPRRSVPRAAAPEATE
jgi:hypothetical protein